MPSHLHETLLEMFRHRPGLAAELLADRLGVALPTHAEARLGSAEVTELRPSEYRADAVPVLTDPTAAARTPELAVLSALSHVRDDGPYAVLDALAEALDGVEVDLAVEYTRLVLAALPGLARAHLEELMATETYEYESEFTRRLEARGQATMLLRILDRRGIEVPADAEERIRSCTDLARFETWADRALTADTIADVLG